MQNEIDVVRYFCYVCHTMQATYLELSVLSNLGRQNNTIVSFVNVATLNQNLTHHIQWWRLERTVGHREHPAT